MRNPPIKVSGWVELKLHTVRIFYKKDLQVRSGAYFSPIAFGNQTISGRLINSKILRARETHGFAPLLRSRFAFIGAIM